MTIGSIYDSFFSEFTLLALKDSGWYEPNL
jgi:hypothetical protein